MAWQGKVGDWQPSGFEAPTPAPHGRVWRGMARLGVAWWGWEGDWQAPRFDPSAPVPRGEVWRRAAWQGGARYGRSRRGQAWHGWADGRSAGSTPAPPPVQGVASSGLARQGVARRGLDWLGSAGCGRARQGVARSDMVPATEVDHGLAPWSSPASGRDKARLGSARRGMARRGWLRLGVARQVSIGPGLEPVTAVGREHVSRPSAAPGQLVYGLGVLRPGGVRNGTARSGPARHGLGGRSSARFDSAPPTYAARRGMAGRVLAVRGKAGVSPGRSAHHRSSNLQRPLHRGWARPGGAGLGMAGITTSIWSFACSKSRAIRPSGA